jgi:hypothetical protein
MRFSIKDRNFETPVYFRSPSPAESVQLSFAADFIKLIAVLAPRLALTIGPYTLEASELIASRLVVLTRTDEERHFLRTVYPSEPILAEVSARLIPTYGLTRSERWFIMCEVGLLRLDSKAS